MVVNFKVCPDLLYPSEVGPRSRSEGDIDMLWPQAKLYIPSTPNNSNETHTFMCLGRTGRFGQR